MSPWGGKRKGAGRPGEGRISVSAKILPEVYTRLMKEAAKRKISLSRLIAEKLETKKAPE